MKRLPTKTLLRLLCALPAITGCWRDEAGSFLEMEKELFADERKQMVDRQLAKRDITNRQVLEVMRQVPRHLFVPSTHREYAYADQPLPIGEGQTISQPYIVAYMTQALELKPEYRVLEIGTGSGYQAAVLAELAAEVYTIEIIPLLAARADSLLQALGYENIQVRTGDGYLGWPQAAPFDAIVVTAAPDHIPEPLVEQLAPGGVMILPVGDQTQELLRLVKQEDGSQVESLLPVRFVPLTRH